MLNTNANMGLHVMPSFFKIMNKTNKVYDFKSVVLLDICHRLRLSNLDFSTLSHDQFVHIFTRYEFIRFV